MDITTMSGVASYHCKSTFPNGKATDYNSDDRYITLLRKPDKAIKNVPQWDGYRSPSSYACEIRGSSFTTGRPNYLPVVYGVSGGGVATGGTFSGVDYRLSGRRAVDFSAGALPNYSNTVRMNILNNVRNEVFDVAMVLAEVSGTAGTLSNNLARVGRSLEQVRRKKPDNFYYLLNGRRKDGRRPTDRFLRESSGVFLEWKYGIMPTIYDIQGATKALDMNEDNSFWERPALLVNRASVKGVTPFSRLVDHSLSGNPGGVNSGSPRQQIRIEGEIDYEHKARIDYSVSGEGLRGLNRYGIGLSSVATIAFERTPFSFVLNMAIPIADLIKAWTALAGCDVRGYCETQYSRVRVTGGTNVVVKNGVTVINTVEPQVYPPAFRRTAFKTVPMPLPHVRNPVKLSNIQTVLALFTQLRKS